MNEADLIRKIRTILPAARQRNEPFECDAELIEIGGQLWAVSVDDFSPQEDLFTDEDPFRLGANLAVATLSDLLACGASPRFFLQALSLPRDVSPAFTDGFCEGLRSVLDEAGCALIGGDIGSADPWRFCGVALGPVPSGRPVTRLLPARPQSLWVTGRLGDANLAAFSGRPTPRFELRTKEALAIRESATGCIDTSGGLFDALWMLRTANPGLRFEAQLDRVPLAGGLEAFAASTGIPPEAALVGGAGEYELLFAAEQPVDGAAEIGVVRPSGPPGLFFCLRDGKVVQMTEPPPDPRGAATAEEHARAAIETAARFSGR